MVTFVVATADQFFNLFGEAALIAGFVALVAGLLLFWNNRRKGNTGTRTADDEEPGGRIRYMNRSGGSHVPLMIVALILLILGGSFTVVHSSNSVVIVEKNAFTVSGKWIGNSTYTPSDIQYAFVENILTGNVTLGHKNIGTASSSVDEGTFTLSNGASADVVSVNHTDLVVKLTSGKYVIVGIPDMSSLEGAFSSDVYSLS